MFHRSPPSTVPIPNRKRAHLHHESKKWIRLPADQVCLECHPVRKPFVWTAFGKVPPEVREVIFKHVLTVGSISPLKDGISVPMIRTRDGLCRHGPEIEPSMGPAKPASCLALVQTCRQIYCESSLLFYSINTLYISGPRRLLGILCSLGPERCDKLLSLHLEDVLVSTPVFGQEWLRQLNLRSSVSAAILLSLERQREDRIGPDTEKALQLLNKRGNLQKIYFDLRPSQAIEYIRLCTLIPGFKHREILFDSPTRWSVMRPSTIWEKQSWFLGFLGNTATKYANYFAYWGGDEKYRVQVDILQALPERRSASSDNDASVEVAMEGLSIS